MDEVSLDVGTVRTISRVYINIYIFKLLKKKPREGQSESAQGFFFFERMGESLSPSLSLFCSRKGAYYSRGVWRTH